MMRWTILQNFLLFSLSLLFVACIKPPPVNIEIALETAPQPPIVGEAEIAITLIDTNGTPITNAALEVEGHTTHTDMPPVVYDLDMAGEDGVYRVPFEWTTDGDWFVMVRVFLANGIKIEQIFDVAVAIAQDEEVEHSSDKESTPSATIEPIHSYRVTYTSLFTNTMPASSEFIVHEYNWQEADNAYGFNSLYSFRVRVGALPSRAMQEEYLIDDKAYGVAMEQVNERDRAKVIGMTRTTMPILTLENGNENPGLVGAYYFPMTIGEIISRSQLIGDEVVNGLLTTHYRTTDPEAIVNTTLYSSEALDSSKAQGDFWVTSDHQYLIRFVVTVEGLAEGTQAYQQKYLVNDINQKFEITLRPDAQAQIDAKREALATGLISHPTCNECIFPVLPESTIYTNPMSERFLNLSFPGHGRTLDQITMLYEQKLVELGWTVTNQNGWYVTDGIYSFSLNFTHMLDDENSRFNIEIIPDPPF